MSLLQHVVDYRWRFILHGETICMVDEPVHEEVSCFTSSQVRQSPALQPLQPPMRRWRRPQLQQRRALSHRRQQQRGQQHSWRP